MRATLLYKLVDMMSEEAHETTANREDLDRFAYLIIETIKELGFKLRDVVYRDACVELSFLKEEGFELKVMACELDVGPYYSILYSRGWEDEFKPLRPMKVSIQCRVWRGSGGLSESLRELVRSRFREFRRRMLLYNDISNISSMLADEIGLREVYGLLEHKESRLEDGVLVLRSYLVDPMRYLSINRLNIIPDKFRFYILKLLNDVLSRF